MREILLRVTLALGMLLAISHPLHAQNELSFGSGPDEDGVQAQIEERVEEQVTEKTDELIFGSGDALLETKIEENIEEQVEVDVEENVTENIETSIVDTIEARVEDQTTEEIDDEVAQSVEDRVEDIVTETVDENISNSAETTLERDIGDSVTGTVETQSDGKIDEIIAGVENEIEVSEDRIHKNQWLVMAERSVFTELQEEGYLFDNITELPGMGVWLADVAAPSSFNITAARQGVVDVVGSNRAEVDLNHIYAAGATVASAGPGMSPRAALSFPEDTQDMSLRIGMIDSEVDLSHPVFAASHIQTRSFVPESAEEPNFHGTAIASIIAANSTDYVGLAPQTKLFAASVFEKDPTQGEFASTLSLIKALDWLASSDVDVINISLAGPPNRLLEAALDKIAQRGILIVAAAGNGGPSSEPMYPAAYSTVVAVTAVDAKGRAFRLANRGKYLDLAAPGVDLLHARAGGGYTSSSGTSFAVPFAATAAARLVKLYPDDDVMVSLYSSAEDRGAQGRDDIYGYGLLHLTSR
jgi:hypothetical protein